MPAVRHFLLPLLLALAVPALAVDPIRAPTPLEAPPPNAIETATGMAYVVLAPAPPGTTTLIGGFAEVRIDAWSADGVTRMNSRQSGSRVLSVHGLARELPGLARAILSTPVGERRRWWIQPERLRPGYPDMPNQLHVFDVTVIGGADPTRPPPDVAAAPADAVRTASGLAYKVLARGAEGPRPGPKANIVIHYTGWTTDGRVFDSSVIREQAAVFPLEQLIPGWQEGVQLMARGDRFRFWIPGPLAYEGSNNPQAPRGMLVFDIELIDFTE
ncbi:MAG TPA: FKBP-type peptidyl-prolyl cis-trans isomerase [Arenimonas sp.]|nr:FKBP-type peptidyl-prolyl cis-trans isomerase [Arenimonas sp.]